MKKIDYLKIIKRALYVTWHNKFLWVFGLIISIGSGWSNGYSRSESFERNQIDVNQLVSFLDQHIMIIIAIAASLVALTVAWIVLRTISLAGMIISFEAIETAVPITFRNAFVQGRKFFWKIIGIDFIIGMGLFAFSILIFLPIFFILQNKAYISAFIMGALGLLIFIPLLILFSLIRKFAVYYVVQSRVGIFSSFECAYAILKKNFIETVIMGSIFLAISIAIGAAELFAIGTVGLTFLIPGILLYQFGSKISAVIFGGIVALTIFVLFILVQAIVETFFQSGWYLFFREISSLKDEKKEKSVLLLKIANEAETFQQT